MAKYNNKRQITLKETIISSGQILEGMVISFRYQGGSDATPLVLVLYNDKKKKILLKLLFKTEKEIRKNNSLILVVGLRFLLSFRKITIS